MCLYSKLHKKFYQNNIRTYKIICDVTITRKKRNSKTDRMQFASKKISLNYTRINDFYLMTRYLILKTTYICEMFIANTRVTLTCSIWIAS